ncbi:MAG: hypothetical protein PUG67_01930 [Peptoniphilaceae bacterium]|nr:hypothetical protein [Peptoniphilaceae bacterium]MDY6019187.1 hypothetical protein [Anaerococcus sp.]
MVLVKYFIYNLRIRFYSIKERRGVNHDLIMPREYRKTSCKEYVFLSTYTKKSNIFIYC